MYQVLCKKLDLVLRKTAFPELATHHRGQGGVLWRVLFSHQPPGAQSCHPACPLLDGDSDTVDMALALDLSLSERQDEG